MAAFNRRIMAGDPETDYYSRLFEANVPHPDAVDLIFSPQKAEPEASAESVVGEALSYRPIYL